MVQRRGWLVTSVVAISCLCGGLAGRASAQIVLPAKAIKQATTPYAQQILELHETHLLLHKADHDYKGHRVKAMELIHAAVLALAPAHRKPHAPGKKGGGGDEPQNVSDAQLQQAIKQLQTVETQLASDKSPGATKAVVSIQAAIKELQIALEIR
jgi:hypothetical protein